ncbi:MAG: esterase-like activity of phytase family protein [Cyclobacteriaceae bacterium]|nr:esterase-like activity of phytase family protein [Cyclobacteriaceae bacterium]
MNFAGIILNMLISFSLTMVACAQHTEELRLVKVMQLSNDYTLQFDLSGIVQNDQGDWYVIADKNWDRYMYRIDTAGNCWHITDKVPLPHTSAKIDFEAVDFCNGWYYFSDEEDNSVWRFKENLWEEVTIPYEKIGVDPAQWKGNTGLEGLAVDCDNEILYLAKEREPRFIFSINLKNGEITQPFDIPQTHSNDFSDLKFENGYLYAIERNGNYIAKIDPIRRELIDKVSYRSTSTPEQGRLYAGAKYGMAEALLLLDDYIVIGLDNNGLPVADFAEELYDISGIHPVLLFFERPEGF